MHQSARKMRIFTKRVQNRVVPSAFFVLCLVTCSPLEDEYQKAEQKNTVEAYKDFLKKYPEGNLAAEAQARIAQLIWNDVQDKFIVKQPLGASGEKIIALLEGEMSIYGGKWKIGDKGNIIPDPEILTYYNVSRILPATLEVKVDDSTAIVDLSTKPAEIMGLVKLKTATGDGFPGPGGTWVIGQFVPGRYNVTDWVISVTVYAADRKELASYDARVNAVIADAEDLGLETKLTESERSPMRTK